MWLRVLGSTRFCTRWTDHAAMDTAMDTAIHSALNDAWLTLHGPTAAWQPIVLNSPHPSRRFPADFGSVQDEAALRDGEGCFIDVLWRPATERGFPLLAAEFASTPSADDPDPTSLAAVSPPKSRPTALHGPADLDGRLML